MGRHNDRTSLGQFHWRLHACRTADVAGLDVSALLEHQDVVDRLAPGVGPLVRDGHDLPITRDRSRATIHGAF